MASLPGIFWSPAFYAQHVQPHGNNGKTGFGLLGLACLFATIMLAVFLGLKAMPAMNEWRRLSTQLPAIAYDDEHGLSVLPAEPFRMEHTVREMQFVILIDPSKETFTQETLAAELGAGKHGVALTRHHIYSYDADQNELETRELSEQAMKTVTYLQQASPLLFVGIGLFYFGLVFLSLWLGHIVLALLLAIVGQASKPRQFATSQYTDLLRVASYSLVPVTLILALIPFKLGAVAYTLIALLHYLLLLQLAKRGTTTA